MLERIRCRRNDECVNIQLKPIATCYIRPHLGKDESWTCLICLTPILSGQPVLTVEVPEQILFARHLQTECLSSLSDIRCRENLMKSVEELGDTSTKVECSLAGWLQE